MTSKQTMPTVALLLLASFPTMADEGQAATPSAPQQSLDDAWWTGPIIAAGAGTMPKGHMLVEPYLFDVIRYGRYDNDGDERGADRSHSYGNLTYILYGVTDRFTAGLIPTFGYNVSAGRDSSSIQLGDVSVQGQYRLTQFQKGRPVPTISLVVQHTLPTGKYDRLGDNVNDGVGSGAHTTTLSLYSQYYAWMPNGRILRSRLNVSYALSGDADVEDVSVYGTNAGFRGTAEPGDVLTIVSAWEYSITREWVFAVDFIYQHDASTHVTGLETDPATGQTETIDNRSTRPGASASRPPSNTTSAVASESSPAHDGSPPAAIRVQQLRPLPRSIWSSKPSTRACTRPVSCRLRDSRPLPAL